MIAIVSRRWDFSSELGQYIGSCSLSVVRSVVCEQPRTVKSKECSV